MRLTLLLGGAPRDHWRVRATELERERRAARRLGLGKYLQHGSAGVVSRPQADDVVRLDYDGQIRKMTAETDPPVA